jgi:hypothetical protein
MWEAVGSRVGEAMVVVAGPRHVEALLLSLAGVSRMVSDPSSRSLLYTPPVWKGEGVE